MSSTAGNNQPASNQNNNVMPGMDAIDRMRLAVEKARRSFRLQTDDSAAGAAVAGPGSVMPLLYTAAVATGQQMCG